MEVSPRGSGGTAVLAAIARAVHREEGPTRIFDDPFAAQLAGDDGRVLSERFRTELPRSHVSAFSRWVCIRSRFTEDLVEEAAAGDVEQYVILGAGLDSFAYRRDDLTDRVRVFEVDHPAAQAWKRQRLADLGVKIPDSVTFTPVDFERQTLRDALEGAGFAFRKLAMFSWIAVTMYLTLEAINATLATIAQGLPGTRVVLTYNQPAKVLDDFALEVVSTFSGIAAEMGEPFVSWFLPSEIDTLLEDHGFGNIVHFGAREARDTYFAGREDVHIADAQRVVTGTVMP